MGDVTLLVDGKDIATTTPRQDFVTGQKSFSSKIHHSGLRGVSGMTPNGLYYCLTDLALSSCTEQDLFHILAEASEGWGCTQGRGCTRA